jgi:hypothetical protein
MVDAKKLKSKMNKLITGLQFLIVGVGVLVAQAGLAVEIEARGQKLVIDGKPFIVKGIEYSPWGPGNGPARGEWPERKRIVEDLKMIEALGCNVVSVIDPPERFFAALEQSTLLIIYTTGIFQAEWERFGSEAFQTDEKTMWEAFEKYKDDDRILLWVLGREVTPVAQRRHGEEIVEWLKKTTKDMHKRAPDMLISHANWPPTKSLDLDFVDIVCFDLYPGWPPEVSMRGFGKYIKEELVPLARNKPLLITEFGANSIEVSEKEHGEILEKCWFELLKAGSSGAVVFSFMDEWWKNYDNPIAEGAWWSREAAPEDALTHDADPEEHYGLVKADRTLKPAYYHVRTMFAEPADWKGRSSRLRVVVTGGIILFVLIIAVQLYSTIKRKKLLGEVKNKTDER